MKNCFHLRPLDEAERNHIYHRVMEEKYSPQIVAQETGCSVVAIRNLIKEKGGNLPSRFTHTNQARCYSTHESEKLLQCGDENHALQFRGFLSSFVKLSLAGA